MKKLISIMSLSLAISVVAEARDSLDGCGLGWEVTQQKTYTATTTRGTTNGIVPPTFGMTTGTMGCDQLEVGSKEKEAADYVVTNFEELKSELATGNGEYVQALAESFSCQNSEAVGQALQQNYNRVVAPARTPEELYGNIKAELGNICG